MTRIVAALLGLSLLLPPAPVLGAGLRAQAPGAGFRSVPAAIFGPTAASSETSLSLGELSNSILETTPPALSALSPEPSLAREAALGAASEPLPALSPTGLLSSASQAALPVREHRPAAEPAESAEREAFARQPTAARAEGALHARATLDAGRQGASDRKFWDGGGSAERGDLDGAPALAAAPNGAGALARDVEPTDAQAPAPGGEPPAPKPAARWRSPRLLLAGSTVVLAASLLGAFAGLPAVLVAAIPASAGFYLSVGKIVLIDMVLSADNAVLIAMASHRLPASQQRKAILYGAAGAILLRVGFTAVMASLLSIPLLRLAGGLILTWIAVKLVRGEGEEGGAKVKEAGSLGEAVRTIIVADFVMSLDNMLAVGGASAGDLKLLSLGLMVSIAFIMTSSALIARWMSRFPILVRVGAAILGLTAGEMILNDARVGQWFLQAFGACLSEHWHEQVQGAVAAASHPHGLAWAFYGAVIALVLAAPRLWRRGGGPKP